MNETDDERRLATTTTKCFMEDDNWRVQDNVTVDTTCFIFPVEDEDAKRRYNFGFNEDDDERPKRHERRRRFYFVSGC